MQETATSFVKFLKREIKKREKPLSYYLKMQDCVIHHSSKIVALDQNLIEYKFILH
jgi:hypothetical protein